MVSHKHTRWHSLCSKIVPSACLPCCFIDYLVFSVDRKIRRLCFFLLVAAATAPFVGEVMAQQGEPVRAVTWSEPPSTTGQMYNMPGIPGVGRIDEQDGADLADTMSDYPPRSRWVLMAQAANFIAHDGWVPYRDNEHDRTIATTLTEDISGEDRTSIAVESMPYDLSDGHELVIQTGDPSNPPLIAGENRILAYVDEGVSQGDTSISIDDGNGNPVTITASSGDRVLSDFQSVWVTHAREQIKADIQTLMTGFVNNGGELDGVALDTELSIDANKGIKHDPRWDDPSKGFNDGESMKEYLQPYTIQEVLDNPNGDAGTKWEKEVNNRIKAEALNEAVFDVVKEDFPNAKGSDWNKNGVTESEGPNALNGDGQLTYDKYIFGTHGNYGLYASIRSLNKLNLRSKPGPTLFYQYGDSPWATLRWQTKFIRTMVRENDGAVQPWLAYLNCCGGGFYFGTVTKNYHREHWIQMALHTDPEVPILYFNPSSESTDQKDLDVDSYMGEVNEAVAGQAWSDVTSTNIDWTSDLIATSVTLPDRKMWRISVKRVDPNDSRSITVNVSNGDTITIPGGEVGAWYETGLNESPTFSYTHPSVDNILPSDDWVDFTSNVWNVSPRAGSGASVSGGYSDPDGGDNAYRIQDEYRSNELSVDSGKDYTFSIWHRKGSGNARIRVRPANNLSSRLAKVNNTEDVWDDGNWHRTRLAFDVPSDVSNIIFEIDAIQFGWNNNYFYQPMLNEGKLEGPYEDPGATVGASQLLLLQKGGNLVSSAVQPSDPGLETVLGSAVTSISQIETEGGPVFDPDTGTDEIGTWEPGETYKIYAEAPTSFTVAGTTLDSASVSLNEGWNWLPYPDSTSVAIDQALQLIQNDLVMVKDEAGRVYRPADNIVQIDSLEPGAAYKVYVKAPVSLDYPLN